MRNGSLLFTSESVSEGHPDKIADQISDRILDAFLARDPDARVACETLLTDQLVVVAGEFRTRHESIFRDIEAAAESIVRQVLADIGYTDSATGIDPPRCLVQIAYAIGTAEPVSFLIDTQGTGALPDEQLEAMARDAFPLKPKGIIDALDLCRPIYALTATYGHFGREEVCFAWEAPQSSGAFSMKRVHSCTPWTFSDDENNSLIHG